MNSIRICYDYIADEIRKQVEGTTVYHNLKDIVEVASKTNSENVTYNIVIIKSICNYNIDYINKFGLD